MNIKIKGYREKGKSENWKEEKAAKREIRNGEIGNEPYLEKTELGNQKIGIGKLEKGETV